ncbi:MAG: ssl1498 family light-harvesting-like protein [Cyanobacteria bacterium P01_A01_bin.40]
MEHGYTVDDERIINNYATEPDTSLANYPSPEKLKHYIFLGAGSTLLVAMSRKLRSAIALLIAFTVS